MFIIRRSVILDGVQSSVMGLYNDESVASFFLLKYSDYCSAFPDVRYFAVCVTVVANICEGLNALRS